jgi:hypothetical protein
LAKRIGNAIEAADAGVVELVDAPDSKWIQKNPRNKNILTETTL